MQVDLATLMLDWFKEHYPSKHSLGQIMFNVGDTATTLVYINGIHIGRIGDDEFHPWLWNDETPKVFKAADPEFFEKIDVWYKANLYKFESSYKNSLRDI